MNEMLFETPEEPLVNYVRVHRRGASLTQRELGDILGYDNEIAVSRHERFESIPPFLMVLGYQVLFRVQPSEMFPGLMQSVERSVEARVAEFENRLRTLNARGARAEAIARKLDWLRNRRELVKR